MEIHHESVGEASPGDNVAFNIRGIAAKDLKRGYVCGDPKNDPPREA